MQTKDVCELLINEDEAFINSTKSRRLNKKAALLTTLFSLGGAMALYGYATQPAQTTTTQLFENFKQSKAFSLFGEETSNKFDREALELLKDDAEFKDILKIAQEKAKFTQSLAIFDPTTEAGNKLLEKVKEKLLEKVEEIKKQQEAESTTEGSTETTGEPSTDAPAENSTDAPAENSTDAPEEKPQEGQEAPEGQPQPTEGEAQSLFSVAESLVSFDPTTQSGQEIIDQLRQQIIDRQTAQNEALATLLDLDQEATQAREQAEDLWEAWNNSNKTEVRENIDELLEQGRDLITELREQLADQIQPEPTTLGWYQDAQDWWYGTNSTNNATNLLLSITTLKQEIGGDQALLTQVIDHLQQ